MAQKTMRPPPRRERIEADLESLDSGDPVQALGRLEIWLSAIHTELDDLNAGLGMILQGEVDLSADSGQLEEDVQTIRQVVEQAAGSRRAAR